MVLTFLSHWLDFAPTDILDDDYDQGGNHEGGDDYQCVEGVAEQGHVVDDLFELPDGGG